MDFKERLLDISARLKERPDAAPEEFKRLCADAGLSPDQARHRITKEGAILEREFQIELNKLEERKELLESYRDVRGGENPATSIQKFKDTFPDIWDTVCPRIYKHADNYGDYRLAYLEWGWAHVLYQKRLEARLDAEELGVITYPHQMVLDCFNLHKEHGFPFFFVSKGICDAAWQSDLKFAVDWKTMRLPFEAFTFILPKRNPLGYEGTGCEGITVYRHIKDGEMHFTLFVLGNSGIGTEIAAAYPFDASDKDAEDVDTLRWVFNTIYAMSARPEYVEGGERVGTKKGTRSEIWTPNVIGRKYAVKSHSFADASAHGSVRLHWRRGHFRQQAFGVGRLQHKVIWIEPMMVGGKVNATSTHDLSTTTKTP